MQELHFGFLCAASNRSEASWIVLQIYVFCCGTMGQGAHNTHLICVFFTKCEMPVLFIRGIYRNHRNIWKILLVQWIYLSNKHANR